MWDECIEVPHATKSVWDESHTSHTVPAPMPSICHDHHPAEAARTQGIIARIDTHSNILIIPPMVGALNDDARLMSVCLSIAYIGPKSRTERPRLKLAQR